MSEDKPGNLIEQLARLTGQVAGQTLDAAKTTAELTAMFGESWLKSTVLKTLEPERLEAMADAGKLLRDARETAGLTLKELTDSLGVKDDTLLEDIESGERIMPLELMFRSASLIARHDPIPFLIKFMRTYNPALGDTLDQWGIMALPIQYERERRWINLYRQHDKLREMSDAEYDRLVDYVDSATNLVLDVMAKEKTANRSEGNGSRGDAAAAAGAEHRAPRVAVEPVRRKPAAKKSAKKRKAKRAPGKSTGAARKK
jgi:transcriptional regulator with XRE-family HTH domain